MKLTEYVVRKKLLTKVTLKDALGSYNTDENEAEVTMTFTGDINTDTANDKANIEVRKLLKWDGAIGSDWLNQVTENKNS